MFSKSRGVLYLVLAGAAIVVGCNRQPPLPKTYSASGTVVYKGGKPMTGGSIEFRSADDPLMRIVSEIGDDGGFKLRTAKDQLHNEGAPEGTYEVIIQPPPVTDSRDGVGQARGVDPITLKDKYKVEAKDNTYKIELPVGPP